MDSAGDPPARWHLEEGRREHKKMNHIRELLEQQNNSIFFNMTALRG
jgi:hypothetical protein